MKCQKCNKNEANTHITKIINGVKTEMYLCSECAEASGEMTKLNFGIDNEFENFFNGFFGGAQLSIPKTVEKSCPVCNTSLDEILKCGKLGCSECYRIYESYLERPIRQIQGASAHTGKIPLRSGKGIKRMSQIESLQKELNQAVMEQNFEKAAQLRDEINELKGMGE